MNSHEPEEKIEFPLLMHEIKVLPIKLLGLFIKKGIITRKITLYVIPLIISIFLFV